MKILPSFTQPQTCKVFFFICGSRKKTCRPRAQANEDSPPPPPPPKVKRSTPHFTVSVSLWCSQETVLPTLPLRVLQGAAVSGERISQGPPGNVVALGCLPPPRRVSEWSVQTLPVGSPFQDVVLTARETGTSSRNLTAWNLLPNISCWVL